MIKGAMIFLKCVYYGSAILPPLQWNTISFHIIFYATLRSNLQKGEEVDF